MTDKEEALCRRVFRDEVGQPRLHNAYVVFADLLGMAAKTKTPEWNADMRLLQQIASAFESAKDHVEDNQAYFSIIRYYTDCVSIVTAGLGRGDDEGEETAFGFTIPQLILWQLEMVCQGVVLRGGIAFGPMYVDPQMLIGEPQVDAYGVEQKRAKYPRIVLHETTIKMVEAQLRAYDRHDESPQYDELLIDKDGEVFLNYLSAIRTEEQLAIHRDRIVEWLADPANHPFAEKYEWLRDYHNWYCGTLGDVEFEARIYRIEAPSRPFRRIGYPVLKADCA